MSWRQWRVHAADERGVALIAVMMLLMLTSAILAGFLVTASGDTRLRSLDRTRTQALYSAHAGLEKLTADLGNLFVTDFSPSATQIATIESAQPTLTGVTFTATDGLGYDIAFTANGQGNPAAANGTISSGPFQGFTGLLTPYVLTATSHTLSGAESRVQRRIQTVAIPVFQFGVFSETDLTFSANGDFNFGGRVHTNGNLFLSAGSGGILYLKEKITAVGEVIRTHLANSRATGTTHDGYVVINKSTGTCTSTGTQTTTACQPLGANQGSLQGNVGSAATATWPTISASFNGYLRKGTQGGITRLNLPLVSDSVGGQPIDLIKRPAVGEIALLTGQRLFALANIRVLLSDTAAAITALPGVSATAPLALVAPAGYVAALQGGAVPTLRAPMALSSGVANNGYKTPISTPLLGGFLKVEYRNAANTWVDVTLEWLNLGVTRRNLDRATVLNSNTTCAEPNPDAIIRLQRVRQTMSNCDVSITATDYWPLTLYDNREAYFREGGGSTTLNLAGVMHYVDLDVNNLRRWIAGSIGASGASVAIDNGYTIYFSDRRGNRNAAGNETGEWGNEDIINGATAAGGTNATLNDGEDMNGNAVLDVYGATARTNVSPFNDFTGWSSPLTAAATPYTVIGNGAVGTDTAINRARVNPPIFFRRALKLTNGGLNSLPGTGQTNNGLTVVAENPVYVEGHYNAGTAAWNTGAAAAIMADSITLLSQNWVGNLQIGGTWYGSGDSRSMTFAEVPGSREAADTWYRFAALSGKTRNWAQTWESGSTGTDGGVHNFLRLLEDWNQNNRTLNYKGSLASFFYSRQATGIFRCCDDVYGLPANRNLSFDTNFLDPSLLPPNTPMFRDINTTGFVQVTRRQ